MRTSSYVKPRGPVCRPGPHGQLTCLYARKLRPAAVPGVASMAMPRFRINVNDKLLRALTRSSDALWPGQGRRGVSRLTRDAIRRYARYSDGNTRRRAK